MQVFEQSLTLDNESIIKVIAISKTDLSPMSKSIIESIAVDDGVILEEECFTSEKEEDVKNGLEFIKKSIRNSSDSYYEISLLQAIDYLRTIESENLTDIGWVKY